MRDSSNDYIEVWQDEALEWRWRRKAGNHKIIAESGESYRQLPYADEMAHAANPDVTDFREIKRDNPPHPRRNEDGRAWTMEEEADLPDDEVDTDVPPPRPMRREV